MFTLLLILNIKAVLLGNNISERWLRKDSFGILRLNKALTWQ